MVRLFLQLVLIYQLQYQYLGNAELQLRSPNSCTCPGDTLTFECTVEGELYGATVWRGSALSNCSSQEITFLHERDFGVNTTTVTAFRNCYSSNNSIVAHSLRVENGSYISQLNVTVTNSDIIGKSIECAYDSQRDINSTTTVGSLNVLKPEYYNDFLGSSTTVMAEYSFDHESEKVIINWSQVQPSYCPLHYNILTSNCGSCPTTTTNTTVICTDVPTGNYISTCAITIQTVICTNIVLSNTTEIIETAKKQSSEKYLIIGGTFTALLVSLVFGGIILFLLCVRKQLKLRSTSNSRRTSLSAKQVVAKDDKCDDLTIKIFDNKAVGIYSDVQVHYEHSATLRTFDNKANGIYYDVGNVDYETII